MKYCLDVYLEIADPVIQVAVADLMPSILDDKVWSPILRAYKKRVVLGEDKQECISIAIRYNTLEEAVKVYDAVNALIGDFTDCRKSQPGASYVRIHKCYWDEKPHKPCVVMPDKQKKSI